MRLNYSANLRKQLEAVNYIRLSPDAKDAAVRGGRATVANFLGISSRFCFSFFYLPGGVVRGQNDSSCKKVKIEHTGDTRI